MTVLGKLNFNTDVRSILWLNEDALSKSNRMSAVRNRNSATDSYKEYPRSTPGV